MPMGRKKKGCRMWGMITKLDIAMAEDGKCVKHERLDFVASL